MVELLIIVSFILIYFKIIRLEEKIDTLNSHYKNRDKTEEIAIEKEPIVIKKIEEEIEIAPKESISPKPITKKSNSAYMEEILFTNIILKIGVVAFILGVGLFLKYSIDKDWIPIWGRAVIGIIIGLSMIVGATKLVSNSNRLFSEGLFGGGVAILYLSVFAGFALDDFKFLSYQYAFVLMIAITILAGLISLRYDAKSTAIFGLIGGFLTPFLINRGIDDTVGLLTYMLILNLGVLYISLYKKWSILAWMAYIITILTEFGTTFDYPLDSITIYILFTIFFLIYSIVPFINEIREKKKQISRSFLILFSTNTVLFLTLFYLLFISHDIDTKLFVYVTIPVASYLLIYSAGLAYNQILLKNLFYIVLAQAVAILLITPSFIFDGANLTIVWSVESLMLIWIAYKSREKLYAKFGLLGFSVVLIRYIYMDISYNITLSSLNVPLENIAYIMDSIKDFATTTIFVLSSMLVAYILLKKSQLRLENLDLINNIIISLNVGLFFLFLNIELYHIMNIYYPNATKFSITILWIVFGITMFIIGITKDIKATKIVGTISILLAITKAFVSDLSRLDSIYKIILFIILGMLLFGVSYFYQSKRVEE